MIDYKKIYKEPKEKYSYNNMLIYYSCMFLLIIMRYPQDFKENIDKRWMKKVFYRFYKIAKNDIPLTQEKYIELKDLFVKFKIFIINKDLRRDLNSYLYYVTSCSYEKFQKSKLKENKTLEYIYRNIFNVVTGEDLKKETYFKLRNIVKTIDKIVGG